MAQLLNSCLAGVSLLLVYHLWNQFRKWNLARQLGCLPPRSYPHKDPLLGLDLLFKNAQLLKQGRSIRAVTERFRVYGATFQHNALGYTLVNTIDSDNIRVVYSDNKKWGVEPFRLPPMEPLCGRGFITTDGPTWERSRALLKPAFAKSNISDLSRFELALDGALRRLPSDGSTVDLVPVFNELFLDTAADFTLGLSLNGPSNEVANCPVDPKSFLKAYHGVEAGMGIRFLLGRFSVLLPKAKWMAMIGVTHRFIDYYVDKALETADKESPLGGSYSMEDKKNARTSRKALLQTLTEQTRDKVEIRNQIFHGMMAAQDTTSVLLGNTFFLLSRHADVWDRFRTEVSGLGNLEPTFDVLKSMKLLRKILNESLRIYPVFCTMGRMSLEDTTLPKGGGPDGTSPIFAPAGTRMITNFYALHRNPLVFGDDVEVFNPDRWDTIKPSPWEYMPFGGGPRGCVGQPKALAEASLVLVKMAQRFCRIESRDDKDWKELLKLTVANANGCKVGLIPAE